MINRWEEKGGEMVEKGLMRPIDTPEIVKKESDAVAELWEERKKLLVERDTLKSKLAELDFETAERKAMRVRLVKVLETLEGNGYILASYG